MKTEGGGKSITSLDCQTFDGEPKLEPKKEKKKVNISADHWVAERIKKKDNRRLHVSGLINSGDELLFFLALLLLLLLL